MSSRHQDIPLNKLLGALDVLSSSRNEAAVAEQLRQLLRLSSVKEGRRVANRLRQAMGGRSGRHARHSEAASDGRSSSKRKVSPEVPPMDEWYAPHRS
jgi:hypothetical protein